MGEGKGCDKSYYLNEKVFPNVAISCQWKYFLKPNLLCTVFYLC